MAQQQNHPTKEEVQYSSQLIKNLQIEFTKNIIGQKQLFTRLLIALFSEGHILLEGVPGLAKTRAINLLAQEINGTFKRVQFTPDLLPSDIVGNLIFNPKDGKYYTKKGPIFANFILADEVNRAPAKVQSALLESMQERQVTLGESTFKLPRPFLVLATQNPIEQEGTYPLPEAQIDRFLLKSIITYPEFDEEVQIMNLVEHETDMTVTAVTKLEDIAQVQAICRKVFVDDKLKNYIRDIVFATRYPEKYSLEKLEPVIAFGGSPRASIAFLKAAKVLALINGRHYVIPEDIKEIRYDILRHRIILTYEAEADGATPEYVVDEIFNTIKVP